MYVKYLTKDQLLRALEITSRKTELDFISTIDDEVKFPVTWHMEHQRSLTDSDIRMQVAVAPDEVFWLDVPVNVFNSYAGQEVDLPN